MLDKPLYVEPIEITQMRQDMLNPKLEWEWRQTHPFIPEPKASDCGLK